MDERVIKFRVGVMVLATLIIAGILVLLFGDTPSLVRDDYTIYMHFNDAPGVSEGTPVRKSGILIGRVRSVRFAEQGGVIVEAEIYRDVKLYHSEVPQVSGSLLGGDVVIQFVRQLRRRAGPSRAAPPPTRRQIGAATATDRAHQQPRRRPTPPPLPAPDQEVQPGDYIEGTVAPNAVPGDQQHAGGPERGDQGPVQRRQRSQQAGRQRQQGAGRATTSRSTASSPRPKRPSTRSRRR